MMNGVAGKRRVGHCFIFVSLLCCITLSTAGMVWAQDLEINDPDLEWVSDSGPGSLANYDYGNVVVGESKTATFNLFSAGPSAVWLYVITLNELRSDSSGVIVNPGDYLDPHYTLGAFSFNPTKPFRDRSGNLLALPLEAPGPADGREGMTIVTDMIFSPTSVGDYSAYLHIFSNDSIDPPGMYAFIRLHGTGIEAAVPEPASMLLLVLGLAAVAGVKRRSNERIPRR